MEKRSHRRIRDLDVLTAFQGLVANEIGCARISMMASEQETLSQWAEYRCARPIYLQIVTSGLHRTAVVPTIGFIQLHVLVIVRLARRELVWINVTAHPTAEWIAQQLREAFPWNEAPGYLIRDRDGIYGGAVTRRLRAMGIRDKPIAPGSSDRTDQSLDVRVLPRRGNVSTT
jgi:hypothetical protein